MATNPFTFGNPIREPERFYGRKQEIQQIINRLLSSAHESTSLVGERRIGKTSLLYYLTSPQVGPQLGISPDKYCMVYVDFQGLTDITPQRFWQRVLERIARNACNEALVSAIANLKGKESYDLFDLEDVFEIASKQGLTIVLLMDEFEYITQNTNFSADFFGGLRSLAIHHGLALISATRQDLADLCHSDEIKGSPFFNIFANVVLRPFSKADTDGLITEYTSKIGFELSEEEKNLIHELGGGYPFFVQMAGYYLVDAKKQGYEKSELKDRVIENFETQSNAHFSYLWSHCTESEKITLLILLTLLAQVPSQKNTPTLENMIRVRSRTSQDVPMLVKRGLVEEEGGIYYFFSSSFKRWLRREIMADQGEDEDEMSVSEWLKTGDHKNIEGAQKVLPHFKKKYWTLISEYLKDFASEFAVVASVEFIKILAKV